MTASPVKFDQSIEDGDSGIIVTETWDLPIPRVSQRAKMFTALGNGLIPQRGQSHPNIPGIQVLRRRVEAISALVARVTVVSGIPQTDGNFIPGEVIDVRYEESTRQETTAVDVNGNPLADSLHAWKVTREVPTVSVEIDRVETALPTPQFIASFPGHVNQSTWSGFPQRTWLIRAPRTRKVQSTQNFIVTYPFSYRPETWDHTESTVSLEFVDAAGTIAGSSQSRLKSVEVEDTVFQIYPAVDFNQLGLEI